MERIMETALEAPECRVCLGAHEEDVHDATLALHVWLRGEIARRVDPIPYIPEAVAVPMPTAAGFTVWAAR
jgi:hypothetical protein